MWRVSGWGAWSERPTPSRPQASQLPRLASSLPLRPHGPLLRRLPCLPPPLPPSGGLPPPFWPLLRQPPVRPPARLQHSVWPCAPPLLSREPLADARPHQRPTLPRRPRIGLYAGSPRALTRRRRRQE